jgi:23S rRNA (cytosine1962-C5)-methyltransferase
MGSSVPTSAPRLRLRVTATAESIVRSGHPWLFVESIREQNRDGRAGELAVIYDRKDNFLAIGLFDPHSPLRVRVLHAGKPVTIDDAWWRENLSNAIRPPGKSFRRANEWLSLDQRRERWLARPGVGSLRRGARAQALHGGVAATAGTIDRADSASAPNRTDCPAAESQHPGKRRERVFIWRTGSFCAAENYEATRSFWKPACASRLMWCADRRRVSSSINVRIAAGSKRWQRDRDVLNAFSFSGGFLLYAARGGAKSVTDLDISSHALESAKRNFALNKSDPNVASCQHNTIQTDAFTWLEQNRAEKFDLIILDPPSLAKREAERAGAIQAYAKLAANGIRALRCDGVPGCGLMFRARFRRGIL